MIRCQKSTKNQKGFTIFELVIVIAILGVIAVFAVNIMHTQAVTFSNVFTNSGLLSDGRNALDMLRKDLHGLSPDSISTMTATNLTFTRQDGNTITYSMASNTLTRNSNILAENISANPFSYLNAAQGVTASKADLVFVSVNLQFQSYNESLALQELIFLRN